MGKNSGDDEAKQARIDEQNRQAQVRAGTQRINSIFDGGTYGTGLVANDSAYDPTKTYYNVDGSVWSPGGTAPAAPAVGAGGAPGFGHNSGASPAGSPYGVSKHGGSSPSGFDDLIKQGKLYTGTASSTGFNDDFYKQRRQAYLDYADPQLEDQYGNAQKQLTYALARGGNLNSSTRGDQTGTLQKLYDTQAQSIGDQALSYETQARTGVEDARSNLITTLNATGDGEGAANAALARSTALSQPTAYSPLSQLFSDFTNTLGIQAAQERAAAASGGSYSSPYNTGLFGNTGRVTVTK